MATLAANLQSANGDALHILAVDDDPLILMNISAMLDDLGHRVSEACSGKEAMACLHADDSIDLLITDHSMPLMTGADLVDEARKLKPYMPAIIASGYGEAIHCGQQQLVKLAKPFSQDHLAAALEEAIAAA